MSIQLGNLVFSDSMTGSQQSFTVVKTLGEGSFSSVFICDWHEGSPEVLVPPSTVHVRGLAEQSVTRLVAVKKLRREWEHGWNECEQLKEVKALRALNPHPCIVPLYGVFLSCETSELYLVFEVLEGNLHHLMEARKGRPFPAGLAAHISQQMTAGLCHIHSSGYFHRDMKPENVLVTTTGILNYRSPLSQSQSDVVEQGDVAVICKIADFGSAREISSTSPYTEYVSGRWYRAPEVLFFQSDYSMPVDMWALGAIMAEIVNLRPIFPGSGQIDQIHRIIEVLGDPADRGIDERGRPRGGGPWPRGLVSARDLAFIIPESEPRDIYAMLDEQTPRQLLECISDLLKFNPNLRLTSQQCLVHEYFTVILPEVFPHILPEQ